MATESRTHRPDGGQAIFVVKLGDGDDVRYAVCGRISTVGGDHRLPGSRQTVAELVRDQQLLAGVMSDDDCDGFQSTMFWTQSGKNITINIR